LNIEFGLGGDVGGDSFSSISSIIDNLSRLLFCQGEFFLFFGEGVSGNIFPVFSFG
jgi:hypothetical protein